MASPKNPELDAAGRRRFIQSVGGVIGLFATGSAFARLTAAASGERMLSLYSIHTQENTQVVYWRDGQYVRESLAALEHQLRDHRTGDTHQMDPRLYDLLFALQNKMGRHDQYEVISGYRSPRTNRMLAKRSSGVSEKSLHMRGLAIDVRLPNTSLRKLYRAAVDLQAGGVGYYPRSAFIHLDLGPPRAW